MKGKSIIFGLGIIFLAFNVFSQTQEDLNALYFPHVDSGSQWETEICIINSNDQELSGTLESYDSEGTKISQKYLTLSGKGRRVLTVGEEFSMPGNIRYMVFSSASSDICGYTKFYQEGICRVAVPAVQEINTGDIYIPHIDSSDKWWTGIMLVNTTDVSKTLRINFNTGQTKQINIVPGGHESFTVRSLFGEVPQPGIESAVIEYGEGVIGAELFGCDKQLGGILLKTEYSDTLYFPHVDSGEEWWTGIQAYNPSLSAASLTVTPYTEDGTALPGFGIEVLAGSKYVEMARNTDLPEEAAWFKIHSTQQLIGFELFGTWDGKQLSGISTVNITRREGVFPKLEDDGWTGVHFVNATDTPANITLSIYDDGGYKINEKSIPLAGHGKFVGLAADMFGGPITAGTYLKFSSDKDVVGFQLNGSADGTMLDALAASGESFEIDDRQIRLVSPGVSASDGEFEDRIRVTWDLSEAATNYELYRAESCKGPKTRVATTAATTYDDMFLPCGVYFYYWVKAINGSGESDLFYYDLGFARCPEEPVDEVSDGEGDAEDSEEEETDKPVTLDRPIGNKASDGAYADKIRITWNTVQNATSYDVYRAEYICAEKTKIGSSSVNTFDDTSVPNRAIYYYWVKANNNSNCSEFSDYDTGHLMRIPDPPTGVSASDGKYLNKIRVTWNAVDIATSYDIYRADWYRDPKTKVGTTSNTSFYDSSVECSTSNPDEYTYFVKARNDAGVSNFSDYDTGYAYQTLRDPYNVSASDGEQCCVYITWDPATCGGICQNSGSASSYKIYRASSLEGTKTLIGTVSGPCFNNYKYTDSTVTCLNVYYYWVKAIDAKGYTSCIYGEPDSGYCSSCLED